MVLLRSKSSTGTNGRWTRRVLCQIIIITTVTTFHGVIPETISLMTAAAVMDNTSCYLTPIETGKV